MPAGTGAGEGLGSLEGWGSPPLGAPTAAPAQWLDPCDLLLQMKGAYAPNQNYLQSQVLYITWRGGESQPG